MNGRWFYCPNCQTQKNIKGSLYKVYTCSACGHNFLGIHAKLNYVWYAMIVPFSLGYEPNGTTSCVHCGSRVYGSDNHSWWPSVCSSCGRDLPTERPQQTSGFCSQQAKANAQPLAPLTPSALQVAIASFNAANATASSLSAQQSTPAAKQTCTGICPQCSKRITISFYSGQNNQRCPECRGRIDVGKWATSATASSPPVQQSMPVPAKTVQPRPSASSQPDFDGCGPCTSCGYVFQMKFNNAVCPRCKNKMTREDAFFSCGSYPDSTPPENQ